VINSIHRPLAVCLMIAFTALAAHAYATTPLPDWTGSWRRDNPELPFTYLLRTHAPMNSATAAKILAIKTALATPGVDLSAPGAYCQPFRFVGDNGGLLDTFEFLFTPGRITLINELGLVRRMFTDGRALPANPTPSDAGSSVGHWEGQTLVVATTGLNPHAKFPVEEFAGAPELGDAARTTERFHLISTDLMQIDTILTAPALMTKQYQTSFTYRRDRRHVPAGFNYCAANDRSIDPITGKQRLDLTPPPDLPPPPTG